MKGSREYDFDGSRPQIVIGVFRISFSYRDLMVVAGLAYLCFLRMKP
jgi:hypothetical protein